MYQLIRQVSYDDFNLVVNNFIKDNWSFFGKTLVIVEKINGIDTTVYYQAMIKNIQDYD